MQNIPPGVLEQIRGAIRRPEGTCMFKYHSESLLDPAVPGGIILEIASGGHVFRLERTDDLLLRYYHSSPGTGTRVATIDLKEAPRCSRASIGFSWTPQETRLYFGPCVPNTELMSASGVLSQRQFRVGKGGSLHQVGDEGVEVLGISVYEAGKPVLLPTAIEAWRNTKQAIEVLLSGTSSVGYMYEVVVANMTLSMLVTGFEVYAKTRFVELEDEGITPNVSAIIESFISRRERGAGIAPILAADASDRGITLLSLLIERGTINFQNYKDCKEAYNKAYGLRFGEIVGSAELAQLQRLIRYRHRITHVSPMTGFLNQPEVPPEEPVFSNLAMAKSALDVFDRFIGSLHTATLALRRED